MVINTKHFTDSIKRREDLLKSIRPIQSGDEEDEELPDQLDELPSDLLDVMDGEDAEEDEVLWMPDEEAITNWRELFPMESFRPWQEKTIEAILKGWASGKKYAVVEGPTGCHAKGTPILMFDGTVKSVEDIGVNDLLMGPDSKPRTVLELHRGRQEMAKVIPVKGDSFVVNLDHILSLQRTNTWCGADIGTKKRRKDYKGINPLIAISVRDWLGQSKVFKHTYKLYRTEVTFPTQTVPLPIPPYILGIWLGNGTSTTAALTNLANEAVVEWTHFANEHNCRVSLKGTDKTAFCYSIASNNNHVNSSSPNPVIALFRDLNLLNNKHVPQTYLTSTRQERLELLAGLLDTDGHLRNGCFEISQKRKNIADSIVFVARSLGFAAYLSPTNNKSQPGNWGVYYRVVISGNTNEIPTRVSHKKATERIQKKSVLRTGFTVERQPEDDYFGFTVDGDNLYVMGDFTVTHNSGKSSWAITLGRLFGRTFLCTPQKMLQNQYMRDFSQYLFELKGRATYPCLRVNYEEWRLETKNDYTEDDERLLKKKNKVKGDPRVPIKDSDYIDLATWNTLPKDHPWRRYNCATAPCNSRKNGTYLKAECKCFSVCEYIKRRDFAMNISSFSLLNFSNMLLFTRLMNKNVYRKRPLLIMDEGHTLESFLYEYATINIGLKQFELLEPLMEFEDFKRVATPFEKVEDLVAYILDKIKPAYETFKKQEAVTADVEPDPEDAIEKSRDAKTLLSSLMVKLYEFIDEKPTDHSHILIPLTAKDPEQSLEGKKEVTVGCRIKPFSVAGLADMSFGSSSSRVLLMSATILDPLTFCKSVGIEKDDVFFIRVPSTFPAENRLIIGDTTVGSMSYKHKEITLPLMLDRISELAKKHGVHKGIIHTGNYENMTKFKKWLDYGGDPSLRERVLFQSERTFEEKESLIKRHAESDEPLILCGPGFLEGIDLKDDLARFNIIMKLPFLSLADPLVKRKAEEFPEWYALQVALALIQAIGRPVRSPTDWAVTYILDLMWKFFYGSNKDKLFPKHIQEAVRWV
jgi:Rad3-related DNA helicase